MKRAVLLTSMPSPYMVELIDSINSIGRWSINVLYKKHKSSGRLWSTLKLKHNHIFLQDCRRCQIDSAIKECNLIIIGVPWSKNSIAVLKCQKKYSKPLVLWCERPGAIRRGRLISAVRCLALHLLFNQSRAVWGIGSWAVDEFKKCLPDVPYFANMPYAFDLTPYLNITRHTKKLRISKPVKFLYSGSLITRKGIDLLVPAFIKLLDDGFEATLSIMGSGELEPKLKVMIPQKFKNNIQFLGFKDWPELCSVYAVHDLLVAPSRYDGWGLVILEGLAAGMPVIATEKVGSAIDFLKYGENGWIIPADDGKSLYKTLIVAMNAPLKEMGIAARKSVERWTLDRAAERWCELADSVVK